MRHVVNVGVVVHVAQVRAVVNEFEDHVNFDDDEKNYHFQVVQQMLSGAAGAVFVFVLGLEFDYIYIVFFDDGLDLDDGVFVVFFVAEEAV